MKLLVLHVSDTHFISKHSITRERIKKLTNSLNVFKKIDDVLIIYSGDVAFKGINNEYKLARFFIGSLAENLRKMFKINKYITVLVVPGNHDLDLSSNKRTRITVEEFFKDNKHEEILLAEEPNLMLNFYEFAKSNHCFENNKVLDQKVLQYDNLKIKINLINSAAFSALDNDKGLHYLPNYLIDKLYLNDNDISNNTEIAFTIMHHHPEWFHETIKQKLVQALFEGTSVLFLGHEHYAQSKKTTLNDSAFLEIIGGGVLSDTENIENSSFNAVCIDTIDENIEIFKFTWSSTNKIYQHKLVGKKNELIHKRAKGYKLFPADNYLNSIKLDEKHNISKSIMDYFVFPRLSLKSNEKFANDVEICESESFIKEILKKKKIIIEGEDNSGKTTILKHLFIELALTKVPLLFIPEQIKSRSLSRVINEVFREQYGEEEVDYIKFQQTNSSQKIALIDDANKVSKETLIKLLVILENEFDYIVISSSKDELNFDLREAVKSYFGEFDTYQLRRFYSDKRRELISNVVCLLKEKNRNYCIDIDIDGTVEKINDLIHKQIQMFRIDPDFIIQCVQYALEHNNSRDGNHNNVFNLVFESNIVNAIKEYAPDDVEPIFLLLGEIAYYIHFRKTYPLKREIMDSIINQYNIEYGEKINSKKFYEIVTNARILKDAGESWDIKFCNNNYLAFFVARNLIRKYNEDRNGTDLNYILDNICFGINSDIILFLSYFAQNPQILNFIYTTAETHMKCWSEFDFAEKSINFISRFGKELKVKPPEAGDKKKIVHSETESEKRMFNDNDIIETRDIYDYDETEVELKLNKLIKAVKYTEMIAKSLPNFSHILRREAKEAIVKSLYSYPNKIIYSWLHEIDDNFDKFVSDLENDYKKYYSGNITKDKLGLIITHLALCSILGLYDFIANIATDKKTINVLNSFYQGGNLNYRIQNILMEENVGSIDSFIQKIDSLENDSKDAIVKIVIREIVRKCLIYHEKMESKKVRYLQDKYFDDKQKKHILITKSKQKNKGR